MTAKVGHYELLAEFASGGMASVHFGRLVGPGGFAKTVAIKRLRPQFARDPDLVALLLQEARLTALVDHPNIVSTLDVVATGGDVFVVMEYVRGESLSKLIPLVRARGERIPTGIVAAILSGVLHGLHAAHIAADARGRKLEIVHRDVSPQNILVSTDGVARIADFGVAKTSATHTSSDENQIFGKTAYLAPEVLRGKPATPRSDIYAAGVVLWETLTGQRLFTGATDQELTDSILTYTAPPPSRFAPEVPAGLDEATLRALERDPTKRFSSGREMAATIEAAIGVALPSEVASWIGPLVDATVASRSEMLADASTTESLKTFAPTSSHDGSRTNRRRFVAVGGAIVALATLGVVAVTLRHRPEQAPDETPQLASSAPPARSTSPATVETTATASTPADDPRAARSAHRLPRRPPLPATAPRASIDCTKKFTVDSVGHIIFRKECL